MTPGDATGELVTWIFNAVSSAFRASTSARRTPFWWRRACSWCRVRALRLSSTQTHWMHVNKLQIENIEENIHRALSLSTCRRQVCLRILSFYSKHQSRMKFLLGKLRLTLSYIDCKHVEYTCSLQRASLSACQGRHHRSHLSLPLR